MKLTRREFAINCGLKLNKIRHLRRNTGGVRCHKCREVVPEKFYFVELALRDLRQPVDCGSFILKKVYFPVCNLCIACAIEDFPSLFKKARAEEFLKE